MPAELSFVETPQLAAALMDPIRVQVLKQLDAPGSASSVARSLDLPRQRIAYHVKELEKAGLLQHIEDVKRGNCVERRLQSIARHYLVTPNVLGAVGLRPDGVRDRLSSAYLASLAAQMINELAELRQQASAQEQKLPTLSLSAQIGFESQQQQHQFAEELTQAIAEVAAKYAGGENARGFRMITGVYPLLIDGACGDN